MGDFNATPYPPPDVLQPQYAQLPLQNAAPQRSNHTAQAAPRSALFAPEPAPPRSDFLIIGLFTLRLALRLIASLPAYDTRATDMTWLQTFLAPYDSAYDLAKISGAAKAEFLDAYPKLLARMKRQDKYPEVFMAMNPTVLPRRRALVGKGGMGDAERREIVDFVDAATEWGSTVPVPRDESENILKMADWRLVADLGTGRGGIGVRRGREDSVMAREETPRRGGGGGRACASER